MKILLTIFTLLLSITLIAQKDVDIPLKSATDQQILDDLIVDGSLAVGQDAVNGESFGFNTIILKENNLRIKFWDTSTSASFPTNDWILEANSSSNGGSNHFSILDDDAGTNPFTVEAGAGSNALFLNKNGRLGLGTSNPSTEIHVSDDDTPTLRLEQDGTSGWTKQVWDMGGNESHFFIKDVTNGSKSVFRIKSGAPENSLFVANSGNVGIGNESPVETLDVAGTGAFSGTVSGAVGTLDEHFITKKQLDDAITDTVMWAESGGDVYRSSGNVGIGTISPQSKLAVNGKITAKEVEVTVDGWPDYVFADNYKLKTLSEVETHIKEYKHLPGVPSEQEVLDEGVNLGEMNAILLQKIEELTLYMIDMKKENEEIKSQLKELQQ